jgi:hypothetical protein
MDATEYARLLGTLRTLAGQGQFGDVERLARAALPQADAEQAPDIAHELHEALTQLSRPREAREAADTCDWPLCQAYTRYVDWDLDGARRILQGFVGDDLAMAYAHHLRGTLAEFAGQDGRPWFERAAKLDPATYRVPPVLSERTARAVCLQAIRSLPRRLRKALQRLPIYVFALPTRRDVPPYLLGCAAHEAIEIYRLNIARYSADIGEAIDELRKTLFHEIGHAFGMDHRALGKIGL